jgi:hypothetical protein
MAISCGSIYAVIRTGRVATGYYTGDVFKKMTPFQAKVHFDHFMHSLDTLKSKGIESNYLINGENKWTFGDFIRNRSIELIEDVNAS